MAIRRCPYCKAIIDESQKYCNNCGTQLLFPQDEQAEEDLKGEKIRDDDFRDEEPSEEEGWEDASVKEEIDLEKILDGTAPFPDDLDVDEADEIGSAPAEPIVKPAPKPPAPPKPKVPAKDQPEIHAPPKFKSEFAREPKPEAVVELGPAPKTDPVPRPPFPDARPKEKPEPAPEIEAKPIPAAPPVEIKNEGSAEEAESKPEAVREKPIELDGPVGTGSDVEGEDEDEPKPEEDEEEEDDRDEEDLGAGGSELIEEIEDKEEFAEAEQNEEAEIDRYLLEEEGDAIQAKDVLPVASVPPPPAAGPLDENLGEEEGRDAAGDEDLKGSEAADVNDEERDEAETREEIARLIAVLEKKHKKIHLSREEKKIVAPLEETNGLPAWADSSGTTDEGKTEAEDDGLSSEVRSFAPGDTMDFEEEVMRDATRSDSKPTIGIPETLSKIEGPDEDDADKEEIEEERPARFGRKSGGAAPDESGGEMESEPLPGFDSRRRLGLFGVLRAGIYDLFFVALLWFAAVWLAARILALPVPALISRAAVPLGLFFGVLFVGYLFLFLFFLGETLGGRLSASKR